MYLNLVQLCFLHCIFCSATNYFESIYYPFIILTKLCVKRSCSGVLELHWKMYFRVMSQHSQNNVFSTVVSQLLITHSVHFTRSMLVLPVGPLVVGGGAMSIYKMLYRMKKGRCYELFVYSKFWLQEILQGNKFYSLCLIYFNICSELFICYGLTTLTN